MDVRRDNGVALLVAMMAMLLLTALGAALLLTTSSETIIASRFRSSAEGLYAADAELERVIDGLAAVPDWSVLPSGLAWSTFVDGPPSGPRVLPDGSLVDLGQVVNLANCQKITGCSMAELETVTAERPWGTANPHWVLYGYGPLSSVLAAGGVRSPCYLVVLLGQGPGQGSSRDALALRAEAYGPGGAHAVVESTVAREDAGVRMLSWRTLK
jgi:hypothetical protein